jgi:hypothetical protein
VTRIIGRAVPPLSNISGEHGADSANRKFAAGVLEELQSQSKVYTIVAQTFLLSLSVPVSSR